MQSIPSDFRPDRTQTEFDIPIHSNASQMVIPDVGSVVLNLPPALEGDDVHALPPYGPRSAYLVDEWTNAPKGWMKSSVIDGVPHKSFFVPVRAGRGLWLDFNASRKLHNYHVAALVSIQGVNALTGQKLKGGEVRQEQYIEKCPVHDEPFGADRFCEKCGFKWTKQNYITSMVQAGSFWIDGFRNADGEVRQFIFTEEEMRSVAKAVLGEERCWAIGVAFYLSKEPIPQPPHRNFMRGMGSTLMLFDGDGGMKSADDSMSECFNFVNEAPSVMNEAPSVMLASIIAPAAAGGDAPENLISDDPMVRGLTESRSRATKKLEIGAGAKINQQFHDDPNDLSFWREKPSGVIIVTYCEEDFCRKILAGPKKDMTAGGEGWLKNIPHGNP